MKKKKCILTLFTLLFVILVGMTGCGRTGESKDDRDILQRSNEDDNYLKDEAFIEEKENDEWKYLVYSHHISVTEYLGDKDIVEIPKEIDGIQVTEIGYRSIAVPIMYEKDVREVVIPEGVTVIGDWAFGECTNLEHISIPKSVNYIGYKAFYETKWFSRLDDEFVIVGDNVFIKYNGDSKKMNIPNGVKYIAPLSVEMLEKGNIPETIIIPKSVVGIEKCAFSIAIGTQIPQDFEKINNIEIPNGVKRIGNDAFLLTSWYQNQKDKFVVVGDGILIGCNFDDEEVDVIDIPENIKYISSMESINEVADKVNTINIPKTVKGIECKAFSTNLRGMRYDINQINMYSDSIMQGSFMSADVKKINLMDELKDVKDFTFYNAFALEELNLWESVTSIGVNAFSSCGNLKNIEINENMTAVGNCAFQGCYGLENIIIPSDTKFIGNEAFSYCNNLKGVVIKEGVEYIGKNAFMECESLDSVTIPASVTYIGEGAFECGTIYGEGGSTAEQYAKENGISFIEVKESRDSSNLYQDIENKDNNDIKNISFKTNQIINTNEKIELLVWESEGGPDEFINTAGKYFNQLYPNITIRYMPVDATDANSKIVMDGPGGFGPDLFATAHLNLGVMVAGGHVEKVPVSEKDIVMNSCTASALMGATLHEKDGVSELYGYPVSTETYALLYNKDLIKDSEVPKTMADLISYINHYDETDTEPFLFDAGNAYYSVMFTSSTENHLYGFEGNDITNTYMNSERAVKQMADFVALSKAIGKMTGDIDYKHDEAIFEIGKLAMVISGSWNLKRFNESGIDYGVTTIPALTGTSEPPKNFMSVRCMFVSSYSKHKPEAIAFAEFLMTKEMQQLRCELTSTLPARDDVLENILDTDIELKEKLKNFTQQIKYAYPIPNITKLSLFWAPFASAYSDIWNGTVTDIKLRLDEADYSATDKEDYNVEVSSETYASDIITEAEAKEMANQYWNYTGDEAFTVVYDGIKESESQDYYAFRYRWWVDDGEIGQAGVAKTDIGHWSTCDFLYINVYTGEKKSYIP